MNATLESPLWTHAWFPRLIRYEEAYESTIEIERMAE